MRRVLSQVGTLMLSFGLLLLATGTFNTFMGLRADLEGFPKAVTGAMMSAFYVGTIIGARCNVGIINRVGHIRAFTAFAAISAVAVPLHPFWIAAVSWIALRTVLGICSAGLYMCTESWLNERVTPDTRGTVLSLHAMVSFLGFGGGQLMLSAGDPATAELFMIAAMIFALGAIPVALTRAIHPEPLTTVRFGLRQLFAGAPVAVTSCVVAGLCTGSLFGTGPLFGRALGLSVGQISALMTALILSGLFLQMPVGWLSDRFDRRRVIAAMAACATLAAVALAWFVHAADVAGGFRWAHHGTVLLGLAAVFGGVTATFYPLGIAYANDYLTAEQRVQASGGLVLAYGIGSAGGPLLASLALTGTGPPGLFLYNGVVGMAFLLFIAYRARRRTWAGITPKESFHAMPDATATPGGVEYDPRWDTSAPAQDDPDARRTEFEDGE